MSKRTAEVQLTQDNVDQIDEETEEPGQFEVASDEQIKQRVIKKARRNKPSGNDTSGSSIFAGLKSSGPFSLLSKPQDSSGDDPLIRFPLGNQSAIPALGGLISLGAGKPVVKPVANVITPYLVQLKALNESVTEWIKKHVASNPHVDLTPIFKDYQTHLASIEKKYKNVPEAETNKDDDSKVSDTDENTSHGRTTETEDSQEEQNEEPTSQPSTSEATDDCLFSSRAKLFYKKGTEYTELGVGTLKVEEASDDKTVRLLLRNDTSVGKILLNVKVNKDIPVSSKGNNLFLVCVPNPPLAASSDSPVSYLLRVKTPVLAEQLLTALKDNVN